MFRIDHGRVIDGQGATLFERAVRPAGFLVRLRGLLARSPLTLQQAWWFERCSAVHTLGMRVAIDVVHLDRDGRILLIRSALPPGRLSVMASSAQVVELASGAATAAGLSTGQTLRFVS